MRSFVAQPILACLVACAPPKAAAPYPTSVPVVERTVPVVAASPASPAGTVRFLDRTIDLQPFIAGFPYDDFEVDLKHGVMFYLEKRSAYTLRSLELGDLSDPKLDLDRGSIVSDVDWSTRGLRQIKLHADTRTLWILADENNDERWNLWTLSMQSKALEPVTHTDYVYGFGFNDAQTQLAYIGRQGARAPFETCVFTLDLATNEQRQVACDAASLRFTWGKVRFGPDDKKLYFNGQLQGDRARGQIVQLDLRASSPRPRVVTDRKTPRHGPRVLDGWLENELVFVANDDGYNNVYAYSLRSGKTRQITHFLEDVGAAAITDRGLFVVHGTPRGTTIEVVDPKTGEARTRAQVPGSVRLLDAHAGRVMWTQRGPSLVFEANLTDLRDNGGTLALHNRRLVELDPKLAGQIVQCEAEAVEIPTFDQDPATGKTRGLHAFVLRPKTPLADGRRLAMVRSFYGGSNSYNRYDHVMCAAGITLISPAVRGSYGFGRTFFGLNDKDLGGDEIVDLFYVGRWIERTLGFEPPQIGVYGRSHGGYATMRALTFPPETNGRGASFKFGFGMAEAGFSDIKAFHDASNIPDWVVLEAGDPAQPEGLARLAERSPIHHVEKLQVPIFLLHGANDWRVPVQGSRSFAERAKAAGKTVSYLEVEGQGHHIEGLDRISAAFQARFDFLVSLQSGAEVGSDPRK
ncbi:MAG: prolyl oligopeptidase family serine peptidase [Nannocystaceae bacterium]